MELLQKLWPQDAGTASVGDWAGSILRIFSSEKPTTLLGSLANPLCFLENRLSLRRRTLRNCPQHQFSILSPKHPKRALCVFQNEGSMTRILQQTGSIKRIIVRVLA